MSKGTQIFNHVIDDAGTVTVEVAGTAFDGLTGGNDDLQTCLELIQDHALSAIPDYPIASTTVAGLTKLSGDAEVVDPLNNDSAVTPSALDYWFENHATATEAQFGFVKLITTSTIDTVNPTDPVEAAQKHAFTLKTLNYALNNRFHASETKAGVVRLATNAQATTTGTLSTTVAMTPQRVKEMLDVWANTTASNASETTKGLIRLANGTEVNSVLVAENDLAISPYRFNFRTATTTRKAGFYLPDSTVANARTSNDHAVTVGTLSLFSANSSRVGVARLANNLTTNDPLRALSAAMGYKLNNEKIGAAGGTITGTLKVDDIQSVGGTQLMSNGLIESTAMLNMYPVGSVYMSANSTSPATLFGGTWSRLAEGRVLVSEGTYAGRTFANGETGGEYEVTLTEDTMPTHKHAGWGEHHDGDGLGFGIAYQYGRNNRGSGKSDRDNYLYYSSPVGGGHAHNNIQPYYTVYMWERTA
ncbi:short tail fibers [Vibrio phage nt-1]|uniref:Short tail fibers n=1 Tax=Vibrio phage nt-1 TaxID=115992 RepID=R9TE66_9CAUD|nr:tail collar fiber protein [Vibrio phage nt-1]AGN30021.1 short tail fibers [Vibrio phage nt-1]